MPSRLRCFLVLFAFAGCGSSAPANPDAASPDLVAASPDLVVLVDLRAAPDLVPTPDLTPLPDLTMPPDLAKAPPDLSGPTDAEPPPPPPRCPPNAGYVGMGGQCGMQGMCGGRTYAVDCDGVNCICSIDKMQTGAYIQMPGSCNTLMQDWTGRCGF